MIQTPFNLPEAGTVVLLRLWHKVFLVWVNWSNSPGQMINHFILRQQGFFVLLWVKSLSVPFIVLATPFPCQILYACGVLPTHKLYLFGLPNYILTHFNNCSHFIHPSEKKDCLFIHSMKTTRLVFNLAVTCGHVWANSVWYSSNKNLLTTNSGKNKVEVSSYPNALCIAELLPNMTAASALQSWKPLYNRINTACYFNFTILV